MAIRQELLKDYKSPEDLLGQWYILGIQAHAFKLSRLSFGQLENDAVHGGGSLFFEIYFPSGHLSFLISFDAFPSIPLLASGKTAFHFLSCPNVFLMSSLREILTFAFRRKSASASLMAA